jgi:hypothetical protein
LTPGGGDAPGAHGARRAHTGSMQPTGNAAPRDAAPAERNRTSGTRHWRWAGPTSRGGRFGKLPVSTPSMIRFGQMTEDELSVTADAAREGVTIENLSESDPLVVLKHFGPGNPDAEELRAVK